MMAGFDYVARMNSGEHDVTFNEPEKISDYEKTEGYTSQTMMTEGMLQMKQTSKEQNMGFKPNDEPALETKTNEIDKNATETIQKKENNAQKDFGIHFIDPRKYFNYNNSTKELIFNILEYETHVLEMITKDSNSRINDNEMLDSIVGVAHNKYLMRAIAFLKTDTDNLNISTEEKQNIKNF